MMLVNRSSGTTADTAVYTPVVKASQSSYGTSERVARLVQAKSDVRESAWRKGKEALVILVILAVVVIVFLWLADELPGVSDPLDPSGTNPPPIPPSPAYYNHTLGPLVPSVPFFVALTSPVTYAVIEPSGTYVYTLHEAAMSIALWGLDHIQCSQYLLNPSTAPLPLPGAGYAYATQDASSILVTYPGSQHSITMYSIDPYSGDLALITTLQYPLMWDLIALTDDSGTTTIAGIDSVQNLIFMNIDTGVLVITQLIPLSAQPLALTVEPANQWLYIVYQNHVDAWAWGNNTGVFSNSVVAAGDQIFAPQIVTTNQNKVLAATLYLLETITSYVLMYSINATSGALILSGSLQQEAGAVSFVVTPTFTYVLNPGAVLIQQFANSSAMNPPTVTLPFTSSGVQMLMPPTFDLVLLYLLGSDSSYEYVIT